MCSDHEFNEGTYEAYCLGRKEATENIKRVYEKYKNINKEDITQCRYVANYIALELFQAIKADLNIKVIIPRWCNNCISNNNISNYNCETCMKHEPPRMYMSK